jgi:DNA-binding NtrC family response regulator
LARFAAEEGKRIRLIAPEAVRLLAAYPWPGNIRQLENALFRAVVLAEADTVSAAEFPQIAAQAAVQVAASAAVQGVDIADAGADADADASEALSIETAPLQPDVHAGAAAIGAAGPDALALLDAAGDVRPLDEIEAELIRFAISHYDGQMSEVARRLRIGRSTLYRKLEGLGLAGDGAETGEDAVAGERQGRKNRLTHSYFRRSAQDNLRPARVR